MDKHQKDIQSLKGGHSAEFEAALFQVQSLKGILQSMEQESKEKDEEHEQEIEKLNNELSTSVMKMSEQANRMMLLQQELASAKAGEG